MSWYVHLAFWGLAGLSLLYNNKNTPTMIWMLAITYFGWNGLYYLILLPKARAKLQAERKGGGTEPSEEDVVAEAGEMGCAVLMIAGGILFVVGLLLFGGGSSCSGLARYTC
ncbi:hypothetical protein [Leisingera caerulea]|uniref:hypothetical protein n=1 Tax=Leisingera caerulea TaxID=506591 RepID=UPI000488B0D7|nr:hypothetical protein [Leisingera caerulea]